MTVEKLQGKKILIVGFGAEGRSALRFLRERFPKSGIGVADRSSDALSVARAEGISEDFLHGGARYLNSVQSYDVIVRSPGVSQKELEPRVASKQKVTSPTALFFDYFPGTIIGVTGTKGKSTTASLIHAVLCHGGVPSFLVGNIGAPALDIIGKTNENSVVVYELSSFQLMDLRKSPQVAVLLNLYPEHLDMHASFEEYREAKVNITRFQTEEDVLIYNDEDEEVREIVKISRAVKIPFVPDSSDLLSFEEKPWLAPLEPALILGERYGMNREAIREAMLAFRPLPHRLEPVGEWRGRTFVDDSQSTHPKTAVRAIRRFGKRLGTVILGGSDKGVSFAELGDAIVQERVPFVVLFPTTGADILREMERSARERDCPVPSHTFAASMEEAVRLCYENAREGSVCLLSPASASFSLFKNYRDRGDQFQLYAKRIGEER